MTRSIISRSRWQRKRPSRKWQRRRNGQTATGSASQPVGAVLVCGGGVAGIQASLDLSAAGYRVYLVEESPTIGGGMARLDKTFPTGDCATCIISPKLVECMRDYNIDVLTMADVTRLEGEAGHFKVEVRKRPRSVDAEQMYRLRRLLAGLPRAERPAGDRAAFSRASRWMPRPPPSSTRSSPGTQATPGRLMPVLQDINAALRLSAAAGPGTPGEPLGRAAGRDSPRGQLLRRFRFEPVGRHVVEVCTGTSCYRRGSGRLAGAAGKRAGHRARTKPTTRGGSRFARSAAWGCVPCRRP